MSASMEWQAVPFREIPHATELFSAFLDDFGRVAQFYSHPPTAAGITAAAREVRLDPRTRRAVVEILREQNRRFAVANEIDPATSRNLDRLAGGAVAIVTGQQAGLFSGPAYTFYKAWSAVRWAQEVTSRGIEAVPIFWIASEDHDWAEVNHTFWNTRRGLARYELPAAPESSGRRVGEILLGDAVPAVVADSSKTLEGFCAEKIAGALRESYAPGENYGGAFGKLMARLLVGRGIIFLDPLDPRFHLLASPIYGRALAESEALRNALLTRSRELESAGLHAQVKVTRESTLLFFSAHERREPVHAANGDFSAGDARFSRAQLAAAIDSHPEAFSPNALLRPIVQDALLPTAAYVGGPAEIAYLAQSHAIYERLLGRMPVVLPRASFTFVEPAVARFMAMYDLGVRDLFAGPQHVRTKMEQKSLPGGMSSRFDEVESALRQWLGGLEEPLHNLDATLVGALQSTREKMLHQLHQLRGKVGRAENFRTGVLDRHQQILFDALYPQGGLQERSLSFLPVLAAFGPELLEDILRRMAVDLSSGGASVRDHQVVFL